MLTLVMLALQGCGAFPLEDLVTSFPGYPSRPKFAMFSGFLTLPASNGKSLHYVFVESQNDPETDPLLLWLNGGPGCSSMLGLYYEHGPYIFQELSDTLQVNPYSWNLNASIIYLESPAGVGFSQYGDPSNLNTNDQLTADDNLQALLQWFLKFPEYQNHDFYVTGESYGGIYVPTLAFAIINYNAEATQTINLRGITIGNGVVIEGWDSTQGIVYMAWSHDILPWTLKQQIDADCVPTNYTSAECTAAMDQVWDLLQNVNRYDLYRPCLASSFHYARWGKLKDGLPCTDDSGATLFLNNVTVQKALHIPASDDALPWSVCADNLTYFQDPAGSLYTFPALIAAGLKILVYYGDTDTVCPFPQARAWISALEMRQLQDHKAWYLDGQVAGYSEVYEGLTYVSVKGVGHMVPQWAPAQAYHIITSYLFNTPL